MSADKEKKDPSWERFECKITSQTGQSVITVELPSYTLQKGKLNTYTDELGNKFEYDLVERIGGLYGLDDFESKIYT